MIIRLPPPHPKQVELLARRKRFNVACCGRRWGKTMFGLSLLLASARGAMAGFPVAWFAPTYKYLDDPWLMLSRAVAPALKRRDSQQKRLELTTGGTVDFWTLDDPNAGKGRKYALVVIDEAAICPTLIAQWDDAIRPTLADLRGEAWFFSTPLGHNDFYRLYRRSESEADWAAFHAPTASNPFIHPDEIEAARRDMPERAFLQNFRAEFLEDGGGVFRGVLTCATAAALQTPPMGRYIIGADWGKHNDFTVLTVFDAQTKRMAAVDRFNQIDYAVQRQRLKVLWERFHKPLIVAESNSIGEPIIEQLRRDGMSVIPFMTTQQSKTELIEQLSLAFERGDIAILNEPVLINELASFTIERTPSGLTRYTAPKGLHDDCVISLALAWNGCLRFGQPAGAIRAPRRDWE
jgi:hypothetical protein